MVRVGPFHRQHFSTQIVDVGAGQLLDVVPGRGSAEPMAWLAEQTAAFRERIEFGTLDLSGPYRRVFEIMVPGATLVADPFHVVKLANTKLDECRRRVQNETLGHRGRKSDPLYRCRRLLTKAKERLDEARTREAHRTAACRRSPRRRGHAVGSQRSGARALRPRRRRARPRVGDPARRRPPGHRLSDRSPLARTHPHPLEAPDRRLASCSRDATDPPKRSTTSSSG